ncbi:Peptidase M1 membrane alanine aminopeptidase (plasmid) [Gemmatirosa kalamazoonensis]|uniref:Peptidase M1 membrane alanine aminopeptidase n=1 Tax=Gemmatirosa kalamazoonensis TaxID=861299 RepID=W0RSA7_9BACT|nr:M1 family aminopeptidase [Gemmatirosa kalamazoonensis]AHG92478.1 Peptidase M1 membrane alanine aminopeptidase [Gemmatirosa kalamazoonensis]
MLGGILRFEWRYHTRRLTFAAAALALAGGAATLVGTGYGPKSVDVNAPYTIAQSLGLLSLFSVFVLTIFCANAALRDTEHGMTELVFSRPIGKPRYLLGRFAGALLAALTAMTLAALVLMLAPLVLQVEPDRLGAVRPVAYLWALVVLVLPNLLLVGAVLYAVATLTRSTLATYVGAVAIYALYLVTALLVDSPLMAGAAPPTPEGLARAALLDPFGLSAFFEQTRYWTPAERDVRMVALSGRMLLNRLLWMGVAATVLAWTYARFRFEVVTRRAPRRRGATAVDVMAVATYHVVAPATRGAFRPALGSAARLELRHVLRGWTFLALLALWVFVAGMEAVAQLGGEYGSHVLPTTGLLLDAMQLPLLLVGTITIVYYAAEVAWRERVVGFDPLVDATPASSAVLYLAKAAALCALPAILALAAVLVGIVVQLANGYTQVEPALWLSLLWFGGVPLALFAIGALAVQAVAPNRWLGLLGGLALALVARRGDTVGLEHPMLHFGAGPSVQHSDLDGFGPAAASFAAFMGYWTLAAVVLACVSWGLWRRGANVGLRARLAQLPSHWGRGGRRAFAVSVVAFVAAAALLFARTQAAHAWAGSATREQWRADYERAYRRLEGQPQPSVVHVAMTTQLVPAARRATVEATLVLENRWTRPIDTVWAVVPRGVTGARVSLAGTRTATRDTRFPVHVFALARPLAPGERVVLRYAGTLDRGGVRADDFSGDVAANGTFLTSVDALPSLGYRAGWELDEPAARRRHGLASEPTREAPLAAADSVRRAPRDAAWLTLDATVATDDDQTALAPGRLVRTWRADGRRWFHYVADRPMTPRFGIVSARYAVRRTRHAGVDVEVWYHPAHAVNVDRMLASATRTLDLLGARYGAYALPQLRVAEIPLWSSFGALSLPGMIFFPEDRGFLSDARDADVDLVTRRVAHEVSHQWWAHTLDPAPMAGASTLTETLAKHSEQLVVGAAYGDGALAPMLAFDEDRYLAGSAAARRGEPTLLEAADEAWLYYGKGAVVMRGLRDLLGPAAVDRALAALLHAHAGPTGMATTLDLRAALWAECLTAADSALVGEWLGDRTVYDLRVDTASAVPLGGGRWRLAAHVTVGKWARGVSGETPRSADGESIGVAVYDDRPEVGRVLWTGAGRARGGRFDLTLDLPGRPAWVVADPSVTRIDRDRTNDRRRVAVR